MLKLHKIRKQYINGVQAIDDLSLEFNKNEIVSIIGPSGCGKTTLLKLVAGLINPTAGSVKIGQANVSIMFQKLALLPWRTVHQNVRLPIENKSERGNITELIHLVGLKGFENAYPHELSGGMQQRVALARSLVLNPDLLLMDEPFGSLDELTRDRLNLELLRIWDELKPTIIVVTHSIPEAVFLSDRVVILSERPAKVKEIIDINLPRPRKTSLKESAEFQEYVKCLREKLN